MHKFLPFVTEDQRRLARRAEDALLALPAAAGVVFAGIAVDPSPDGADPTYRAWIGCTQDTPPAAVRMVAGAILREILGDAAAYCVDAHRGRVRP